MCSFLESQELFSELRCWCTRHLKQTYLHGAASLTSLGSPTSWQALGPSQSCTGWDDVPALPCFFHSLWLRLVSIFPPRPVSLTLYLHFLSQMFPSREILAHCFLLDGFDLYQGLLYNWQQRNIIKIQWRRIRYSWECNLVCRVFASYA